MKHDTFPRRDSHAEICAQPSAVFETLAGASSNRARLNLHPALHPAKARRLAHDVTVIICRNSKTETTDVIMLCPHEQDFYEDVFEEMDKFGEVENLNVCDNIADHMVGSVYVKFVDENAAAKALQVCVATGPPRLSARFGHCVLRMSNQGSFLWPHTCCLCLCVTQSVLRRRSPFAAAYKHEAQTFWLAWQTHHSVWPKRHEH